MVRCWRGRGEKKRGFQAFFCGFKINNDTLGLSSVAAIAVSVSVSVVSCAYPAGIAESQSRQGAEL